MRTMFTYHNLYLAYLECRQNKRKTRNALRFEIAFETKLETLSRELRERTYRPGRSLYFVVTEPKPREIFAADFRDRVVHHLFVRELLPYAERRFTRDSFACRPGKGTHRAVSQLRHYIGNGDKGNQPHFLQLDIKTFFPGIDKNILFGIVERMIRQRAKNAAWTDEMLWLARVIVFHDPTLSYVYRGDPRLRALVPKEKSLVFQPQGKGLPIGNYTSQFFANVYLNELDYFVKRVLGCRRYVRYVDDVIVLDVDPARLREWRREIARFLRDSLLLRLHPKKTHLQPVSKGIDFLGYFLKTEYTLVRCAIVRRLKKKLREFRFVSPGADAEGARSLLACLNSYCGHFRYARGIRLNRALHEHYLGVWKHDIGLAEGCLFFRTNEHE